MSTRLPDERIYLDRGGDRLTHVPSGDTCLRAGYMVGPQSKDWLEKLSAFLARHPEAKVVVNDKQAVIGHADRHPILGRPPEIGETLVRVEPYSGDPSDVATVVGIEPDGSSQFRDADESPFVYRLDDGALLYWDSTHQGWMARGWNDRSARYREPLDGEDLDDIRTPIEVKSTRCVACLRSMVYQEYPSLRRSYAFDDADLIEELREEGWRLVKRTDLDDRVDHSTGIDVLASAFDLVDAYAHLLGRAVAEADHPERLDREFLDRTKMVEAFVASDAFVRARRTDAPGPTEVPSLRGSGEHHTSSRQRDPNP